MDRNMSLDDLIKKEKSKKKQGGPNAFGGRGGAKFGGNFRGGNRVDNRADNRVGNFVPRIRRGGAGGIFKRERPQFQAVGGQQGGARPLRRGGKFGGLRNQRVSIFLIRCVCSIGNIHSSSCC